MTIIVDIDGTIADNKHRQNLLTTDPKNWDAFFDQCPNDAPIFPVVSVVIALSAIHHILMVTGRSEKYREMTKNWLNLHLIPCDGLYMRADGDYRPDEVVKEEILARIRETHTPILALDDRQSVVDMWRRNGLICLQNEPKYC